MVGVKNEMYDIDTDDDEGSSFSIVKEEHHKLIHALQVLHRTNLTQI